MHHTIKRTLAPLLGIAVLVLVSANVRGETTETELNTFESAIQNMSKSVASYLKENNETSIAVGAFAGPGASTAGRSIQVALTDALKTHDIKVLTFGAKWTLRGRFKFEKRPTIAVVLVTAELIDSSGSEVSGFRERIESEEISSLEDITRILGLTVDVLKEKEEAIKNATAASDKKDDFAATAAKVEKQNEILVSKVSENVEQPTFTLASGSKTRLIAEKGSLFSIEFLVRRVGESQFQPAAIQDGNGIAFVDGLKVGDVYKVRVYNDAKHNIGVKISVDGINSFALCDNPGLRDVGCWIVPAGQSGVIPGWFVQQGRVREFLLTNEEEIAGLPPSNGIGTVTAQFFHAWGADEQTPEIELLASKKGDLRTKPGLEITGGSKLRSSFFGKELLTSISLRYSFPVDLPPK